jgi:hypothetical protein
MPRLRELEGWYTMGQAAEVLGWSRQGVIDLAVRGRVTAVQVGARHPMGRGAWIFDPDDIEAFAALHEGRRIGGGRR